MKIHPVKLEVIPGLSFFLPWTSSRSGRDFVPARRGKFLFFTSAAALRRYVAAHPRMGQIAGAATTLKLHRCRSQILAQRQDGEVVNVLNLLWDLAGATEVDREVWELAQYATFDADLRPFFSAHTETTPEHIAAVVDRLTGWLFAHAVIKS